MGRDSSLASALEQLVGWHVWGIHVLKEVVRKGVVVLEGGGLRKMGDKYGWGCVVMLGAADCSGIFGISGTLLTVSICNSGRFQVYLELLEYLLGEMLDNFGNSLAKLPYNFWDIGNVWNVPNRTLYLI